MKRIAIIFGAVIVIVVALVYFYGQEDDAAKIRSIIKQGAEAVHRQDLGGSLENVSLRYRDERGISYFALKNILRRLYNNTDEIVIDIRDIKIEINGDRAKADIALAVMVAKAGNLRYIIGTTAKTDIVSLHLEKRGLSWVITRVGSIRLQASPF